jgi:hypothetical protein
MLNELWDIHKDDWGGSPYGEYRFEVDGVNYYAGMMDDEDFDLRSIYKEFEVILRKRGHYEMFYDRHYISIFKFTFGFHEGTHINWSLERDTGTKKGNAIKVLSSVISIFKDAVKLQKTPKLIHFSGKGKRIKVYNKLVKYMAKAIRYEYMIFKGRKFGSVYILYKI